MDDMRVMMRLEKMRFREATRWCNPEVVPGFGCGCMGCANISGGLAREGVTKEQWQRVIHEMLAKAIDKAG